jgi:hypothetical protein
VWVVPSGLEDDKERDVVWLNGSVERFDSVLRNHPDEKVIERRKGSYFYTTSLGAANE